MSRPLKTMSTRTHSSAKEPVMKKLLKTLIAAMTLAALQLTASQAAAQTPLLSEGDGVHLQSRQLAVLDVSFTQGLRGGDYGV